MTFDGPVPSGDVERLLAGTESSVLQTLTELSIFVVELNDEGLAALEADPRVIGIEVDIAVPVNN